MDVRRTNNTPYSASTRNCCVYVSFFIGVNVWCIKFLSKHYCITTVFTVKFNASDVKFSALHFSHNNYIKEVVSKYIYINSIQIFSSFLRKLNSSKKNSAHYDHLVLDPVDLEFLHLNSTLFTYLFRHTGISYILTYQRGLKYPNQKYSRLR